MKEEKVGKLIKELRLKNHLTQKQFADKYFVTYQAVSKWEQGKNLPDISLLKEISKDYNIPLDSLLEGEITPKKNNKKIIVLVIIIIILSIIFIFLFNSKTYNYRTINTSCKDFNIRGNLSYDSKRSSIFISNIDYCGNDKEKIYKEISCTLYEKEGKTIHKISKCNTLKNNNISLDDYLKSITMNIEDYKHKCNNYDNNSLYLEIITKDLGNKTKNYKVPLKLASSCEAKK